MSGVVDNVVFFLVKLPFLPVIAAVTFEIQRVFARYCTTGPLRALLWPGFLVQKITTIEPDDDQLEVALASLRATLWREQPPPSAPARSRPSAPSPTTPRWPPIPATAARPDPSSRACSLSRSSRRLRAGSASSRTCSARRRCSPTDSSSAAQQGAQRDRAGHPRVSANGARSSGGSKKTKRRSTIPSSASSPRTSCPSSRSRPRSSPKTSSCSSCRPIPTTRRTSSSRSAAARAAKRRRSSRPISSACTRATPRRKRWKVEILNESEAQTGGYKEVIALVTGQRVYSQLRFEGGVHRVQRVPATETQGRIHTSTATVAVLPEAEDVDVQIDDKDLEIAIAASGGPGGQGVNTTNSAVQIPHMPTGMIVKCQDERSQLKNKAKALKVLRAACSTSSARSRTRPSAPSGARWSAPASARRRSAPTTIPQNRVTDHRIGLTLYKLDRIIEGDLDELISQLRTHRQAELLFAGGLADAPPSVSDEADR